MPWISGGRIPVTVLNEAETVVAQIVAYERTPPADPDYYRRMTFAAFFQDNSPQDGRADRAYMKTMESIRDHMISIGFDVDRVYVSNNPNPQQYKDGTNVPAAVRNAIMDGGDATDTMIAETSEGQFLIGHRDHGGEAGWAHPAFRKTHLPAITSAMPSIFHSINCLTGRFDYNPSDSFAEAILKMKGGGTLANRRYRAVRHMAKRQSHERAVRCRLAGCHRHVPGNDSQLRSQVSSVGRHP